VKNGINVIQQNLEDGLRLFEDGSFDFAILSQTLQTIHQTAAILRETVRVGKECIVSFPNFGYWSHRLSVLQGRMPVSKSLPYQWHNTPNVRVLTIKDFEALAEANMTALAGVQQVGQKQADIFRAKVTELQSLVTRLSTPGSEGAASVGEGVKDALQKAFVDMQELADAAYRAQTDSIAVVTKRFAEHVEELKALMQQKK